MNIKLNVKNKFNTDFTSVEKVDYTDFFNYKLLKIIIFLETQDGENEKVWYS